MIVHGRWCNTKTFPLNCRYCGEQVFYFSCDHESRVFFDELGDPWPKHNCGHTENPVDNSPSTIPSIPGINWIRGGQAKGNLLPGLVRGDSIDPEIIRRVVRKSQNQNREIVRIDPLGSIPEVIIGKVQDRVEPDLPKRYGIDRNSIGYSELAKKIGDADPVQFTVLVDELASDPEVIDQASYTFLCARQLADRNIRRGALVEAHLEQTRSLGIGPFWLAKEIERLD